MILAQIQEGTDTLTVNWPTGTADRTISFPDAGGTVALTTDVNTPGNGVLLLQVLISALR